MEDITTYLMYFSRLYITCLILLSKLSRRDRDRTYCNNIKIVSLFFSKIDKKNTNNMHENKKIQIYIYHNNYLDEDMPIMHYHPHKITFLGYDIVHVQTKSGGKFNFLYDFYYKIVKCYYIKNHGSEFILTSYLLLCN